MSASEKTSPPPPNYSEATGASSGPPPSLSRRERNGISPETRRSMEDERRPLPEGWVRSFDPQTSHQFFVDTRQDPPRAIWHHPLDDEAYLATLDPAERDHVGNLQRQWSQADVEDESTDEDSDDDDHGKPPHHFWQRQKPDQKPEQGTAKAAGKEEISGPHRLGRRVKDAVTGTTHEQREEQRRRRAEREADLYRQHQIFRRGLEAAMRTKQPQRLGDDDNGRSVYLEPPGTRYRGVTKVKRLSDSVVEVFYERGGGPHVEGGGENPRFVRADDEDDDLDRGGFGYGRGYQRGGYAPGYMRPYAPYGRPYGYGYGGGMGLPMMAPLFGGMMLGGLLF
ncbi:hypothetical protein F5Y18DRAFT_278082 [Xylariaceae sp. FL1019]|nr:hypothetical protein F5Y18DRAFT_278082 [Xylariaceae sp. FL1019]